ncbi:MAG: peptidylprolyl isomerase, partial [Pseudomonadota bacterium]
MSSLPKRSLRLLALSLWLMPALAEAAPAASIATLDRILVVVNDDVVTHSELSLRVAETKKQLQLEKITPPPDDVLRRQILEHLVFERVQLQIASQTGIRVSETEVDKAFESIAQQNKMSAEEFLKFLRREGLDPATHRANLRNQMLIRQLQEREVLHRVAVTDAEVDGFLENQESRDSVNFAFHLSHIFIAVPESASPEAIAQAKGRAEEALQRIRQGGDFAQAAIGFSQGPEALSGGNLGWKNAGQLPELFLSAIKNLASGSLTDVLRSPNGFHILRVNDRRGDVRTERVTQTHARHILLKSSEIQSLDDARAKLTQLRERIENGDDFAALARAHSEDPGSAINGGDLGWVSPGQLVPEFEKAMSALKPNGLSAPTHSPFGLHLIQVLGRRDQDVTQERTRGAARNQIHARKADERYEQWSRQLRDEAFVEYLPDET